MLLLLIWCCLLGVGAHRTFGSRRQAWIGWMHANKGMNPELHILHAIFGRTLFGIVIGYWLYMAYTGKSMVAQWLMGWQVWAPIARLSYAAYLFTFLPVWLVLPKFMEPRIDHLDPEGLRVRAIFVAAFMTIAVCLYALAFILCVAFEMPLQLAFNNCSISGKKERKSHRRRSTWDVIERQTGNYI